MCDRISWGKALPGSLRKLSMTIPPETVQSAEEQLQLYATLRNLSRLEYLHLEMELHQPVALLAALQSCLMYLSLTGCNIAEISQG